MIGYFLVESKFDGRYISPKMSVLPSRPFILIVVTGFQLAARSAAGSAPFSSGMTSAPVIAFRNALAGGTSDWDQVSTRYFPEGDNCASCVPSSGVSEIRCVPSRLMRYECV